jgi:RNA polymerase sigma factor (sigma-70 family)
LPDRPTDTESSSWVLTTTTAISRGDRAAFAVFYQAWFDRCYALARSLTGRDESFCLDVVQDAMLRVIRSLKPLPSHAELSGWMTRVVHSAALDLLRRESRRLRREAGRGSATRERLTASDERVAWLMARLRELPGGDASLLVQRIAQDRTLDAVGAAAGISGDAVHGRVRRAVDRLKKWAKESSLDQ